MDVASVVGASKDAFLSFPLLLYTCSTWFPAATDANLLSPQTTSTQNPMLQRTKRE